MIDADHLLPCRVRAAGKDAGLHRRAVAGRADQVRAVDPPVERAEQAAVAVAAADEAGEARLAAKGGDVAGGVRRPARDDRVARVVEDQHGRFARDARRVAVEEAVADDVADHRDAVAAEPSGQIDQPRLQVVVGPKRLGAWGWTHGDRVNA